MKTAQKKHLVQRVVGDAFRNQIFLTKHKSNLARVRANSFRGKLREFSILLGFDNRGPIFRKVEETGTNCQ